MSSQETQQSVATVTVLPSARISGQRILADTADARTPIFSAASGERVGWQETASASDVDAAVLAARAAFDGWRGTPAAARGEILKRVAVLAEAGREHLVGLQMRISGKPRLEADTDVSDVIACFSYYAALCAQGAAFQAEIIPLPDDSLAAAQCYEPVGVAALIVPWNFPMVTTAWKLAPALAAGCTIVLKPSEITSPAEHALIDIVAEAGVPDGVVNIVNGGANVGALLTAHPCVDKISFTGSTAAGKQVMRTAAEDMKRLTLELGGKSALIVRQDADVEMAVGLAVGGAFTNAGQMCSATSRILVHDSLYRKFMAAFELAVRALVVAPPDADNAAMGPLISEAHRARVRALLQQGIDSGARVAFSGRIADVAEGGFFMAPVVVAEPSADNILWTDEVFGPVACVKSFRTDEEAVALANGTRYGLVATVVTRNAEMAEHYRMRLRAGLVWVNTPQLIYPQVCWGGLGLSGVGRELGVSGLRSYQELRHVIRPAA
ncbi:aldehyde dehydrogenase [Cupriavidus necator]|uniref:Aldehyde dehydrogenase n=1 Tax=Cupriavidus necator TaxID=106590 RepID=A0A1U9V2Y0_CUPNE|nr:aldehyde dehydrogenase family protein [Cupriavidus necator]AQV98997.1 aldehyde dehydrogenase [Cupriavidus necator]